MRTRLLPRVVPLLLAVCGSVCAQDAAAPKPGSPGGGLWKAPPHRAVPIELEGGIILARGGIARGPLEEGSQPAWWFAVGSAATLTVVGPELARWAGGSGHTGERLPDRTIFLGGAEVDHRPVFVADMGGLDRQTGSRIGAIAGSDIFLNFAVRIDYVHRWMMLEVPESCATPQKKLAVRVIGGLPFIQASVSAPGGAPVQGLFLVDTGQPGAGLILTSEFLAKHPELTAHQTTATLPAFDAAGAVRDTTFLRVGTLLLGDQAVPGVVAAIAPPIATPVGKGDSGLAGVIGAGVLRRFDLLVDLPRQLLSLTPNADFTAPFEADMSGILLGAERDREHPYTIAGIAAKSPASEAGLEAGDRLLTVAGRTVTEMSLEQIREVFQSKPGAKVTVGVERAGRKIQVTLILRRAL